jgi:hypothetical protein
VSMLRIPSVKRHMASALVWFTPSPPWFKPFTNILSALIINLEFSTFSRTITDLNAYVMCKGRS